MLQVPQSAPLLVQGADTKAQPSRSWLPSLLSLPLPPYDFPLAGPAPLLRHPTSASEGTWCRQGKELLKETGIDVALARSPPNRSKMPRTHKEPLQSHRLGPGLEPEDPVPLPRSGAIFGLSVVSMEYLTLSRRRQPRPSPFRVGGGPAGGKPLFHWLASPGSSPRTQDVPHCGTPTSKCRLAHVS